MNTHYPCWPAPAGLDHTTPRTSNWTLPLSPQETRPSRTNQSRPEPHDSSKNGRARAGVLASVDMYTSGGLARGATRDGMHGYAQLRKILSLEERAWGGRGSSLPGECGWRSCGQPAARGRIDSPRVRRGPRARS